MRMHCAKFRVNKCCRRPVSYKSTSTSSVRRKKARSKRKIEECASQTQTSSKLFLGGEWINESGDPISVINGIVTITYRSGIPFQGVLRDVDGSVFLGQWKLTNTSYNNRLVWKLGRCVVRWYRQNGGKNHKEKPLFEHQNSNKNQKRKEKEEKKIPHRVKKTKKQQLEETKEVQSMVEFHQILHFLSLFKHHLNICEFTPEDLASSLVDSPDSKFLDLVMRQLLFQLPEVKQTLGPHQWESRLRRIFHRRALSITDYNLCLTEKDYQMFFDLWLGIKVDFYDLSTKMKVVILANLCDWVAESSKINFAAELITDEERTPQSLVDVVRNASGSKSFDEKEFSSSFHQKVVPKLHYREGCFVGRRIGLYWDGDLVFYDGKLTSYKSFGKNEGKYEITYDEDGSKEHICIDKEIVKWMSD